MSVAYLLDTNVLSEPLRPEPSKSLLRTVRKHEGRLATCAPVWHELLFGYRRLPDSRRRTLLETYLRNVVQATIPILPYDETAAEWHARERARLSSKGRPPAFVDGQIASIAAVHDLTVVTANKKDFARFEIKTANWF
ncbi:type II toxin-antitoxin system VapC family toxin [Planctomycetota bacterium]